PGIGDELLPLPVVELLQNLECPSSRPPEARAALLLQGGQIMQPRWRQALLLHLDGERAREAVGAGHDHHRLLAPQDLLLRSVPHQEYPARGARGRYNLEVGLGTEGADLELPLADDREGRRLHAADADDRAAAAAEQDGRGAGEREVVDLVRLLPRHRGGIEILVVGVRLCPGEGVANGLWVLGSEHDPHYLAAEAEVLEDLLADQLALAIAVGGKPDAPGRAERFLDRLELACLVPARRGLGPEEPL